MNHSVINSTYLRKIYKRRENWSHKGNFGKIVVIGGSYEYTGSPALVAMGALRAGADVAKILAPKRAADACASFSPEIITVPLDGDSITYKNLNTIKENMVWPNVVTIGNGIGEGDEQGRVVNEIIKNFRKKFVIDADGLKVLDKELLNSDVLLTPNTHEFDLLFNTKLTNNVEDRISAVKEAARRYSTNILLKGHVDIISDGEHVFVNKTNSVYMAKGGTGDVLAGICAGVLGHGVGVIDAACAAAFINGYTGRYVAKTKREALSAVDILDNIYSTITKWRYQ